MGESNTPDRIEIALTSDDPASPFSRPDAAGEAPPIVDPRHSAGDERRTIVVALAVGVVAVALGWMLGRSGAGSDSAPVVPEVSAPDRSESGVSIASSGAESSVISAPPGGNIAAAPEPTESVDRGGDAPVDETIVETIGVAPELAGQPIEVIVYGNGNKLQRLDLTTGRLVTRKVDRQPFGRPRVVAGEGWVMLPTADPVFPTIVVRTDGKIRSVEFSPNWFVLGSVDGETVWLLQPNPDQRGERTLDRRTELGGVVDHLDVPGTPSRFDPRGGFVIEASGGFYSVTRNDVARITPGELLAIGPRVALAEECDDRLSCAIVVIDRNSGERRVISRDQPGSPLPRLAIIGRESVAPVGDLAVVRVVDPVLGSSGQPVIGTVDLATGMVTEIGPAQGIDQSVWTPDGRFVLYVSGGKLVAFEPASGERVVIADELIAISAFATRPVAGG